MRINMPVNEFLNRHNAVIFTVLYLEKAVQILNGGMENIAFRLMISQGA